MALIDRIPKRVRTAFERPEETVHDFLGVVQMDPELAILVLPDHVAAIVEMSGTDYFYLGNRAAQDGIEVSWANILNNSRLSLQTFVDRRPIDWTRQHLEPLFDQVIHPVDSGLDEADPWAIERYRKYEEDILAESIEALGHKPADLRQLVVIRHSMGTAESVRSENESIYLPPRRSLRFWEKMPTVFGADDGLERWRQRRHEAAFYLSNEVQRFMDVSNSLGFGARRIDGLELARLFHLLWMGEQARDEGRWIEDDTMLRRIVSGESATAKSRGER
jgi:hypothetical protein